MSWNKGFTKLTHPSLLKTSQTFHSKNLDNFKAWRDKMREQGRIPSSYPSFVKNEYLAEYIGVVLGDGNISAFPRSERLIIVSNANNEGFINRYSKITEHLFNKRPTITNIKAASAVRISVYQQKISARLGIPTGNRFTAKIIIPMWIWEDKKYIIALLKGLFEAEGSLSIHLPTYTYNFQFKNTNPSLLKTVTEGLKLLGFHPEVRIDAIRLRKKAEVETFRNLISFRNYDFAG